MNSHKGVFYFYSKKRKVILGGSLFLLSCSSVFIFSESRVILKKKNVLIREKKREEDLKKEHVDYSKKTRNLPVLREGLLSARKKYQDSFYFSPCSSVEKMMNGIKENANYFGLSVNEIKRSNKVDSVCCTILKDEIVRIELTVKGESLRVKNFLEDLVFRDRSVLVDQCQSIRFEKNRGYRVGFIFLFGCREQESFNKLHYYLDQPRKAWSPTVRSSPLFLQKSVTSERRGAQKISPDHSVVFERYSIQVLTLVGTLLGEKRWALMCAPNHAIKKIEKGSLIGKEKVRVVNISSRSIKLLQQEGQSIAIKKMEEEV